jgi:Asp-tRNA(Asn)/Glu-tRNA(Gln) amidotransferase A subunit family amidase
MRIGVHYNGVYGYKPTEMRVCQETDDVRQYQSGGFDSGRTLVNTISPIAKSTEDLVNIWF